MLAHTPGTKARDPIAKIKGLIRRKTSEKLRLEKDIAACQAALAPMAAQQELLQALDREIHALFQRALANPKLTRRARSEVRDVYEELQDEQVISLDPERVTALGEACDCPFCSGAAADASPWPEERRGAQAASPETERMQPSSPRPERDAGVRALYRKLALHFHPDRAQDEARRAEHEAVMREVNDAYHGGDTERLLELSRELGIEVGELRTSDGLLAELVRQYEQLKAEVRAIRNSPLGMLVADVRRAERDRDLRSPLDAIRDEAEAALHQLTEIRDLVRDFADGKVSLKAFLRGPQTASPFAGFEDVEQDQLEELVGMFEELVSALNARGVSQRRPKGAGRR
jgi:hypothetical protein